MSIVRYDNEYSTVNGTGWTPILTYPSDGRPIRSVRKIRVYNPNAGTIQAEAAFWDGSARAILAPALTIGAGSLGSGNGIRIYPFCLVAPGEELQLRLDATYGSAAIVTCPYIEASGVGGTTWRHKIVDVGTSAAWIEVVAVTEADPTIRLRSYHNHDSSWTGSIYTDIYDGSTSRMVDSIISDAAHYHERYNDIQIANLGESLRLKASSAPTDLTVVALYEVYR